MFRLAGISLSKEVVGKIYCSKCGAENNTGYTYCSKCGAKLVTPHEVSKKKPQKNQWVVIVGIVFILGLILFSIFYIASYPIDQIIEIGDSNYNLSKEAQQYLKIVDISNYEKTKSVIIIEEPHWDLESQYNLYKGLEIFFKDNPTLVNDTIFLSEGFPSGKQMSVQPLIDVNANPSEELIREVLSSYLITGYIAYEWKYQKTISIVGTEDKELYDLSARLWLETQDNNNDKETLDFWTDSVVARNKNIGKTLIENTETYGNPILFVGGMHLYKQDNEELNLTNPNKFGLYDYLKKEKIGYTFITAKTNPFKSIEKTKKNIEVYTRLFKAQQSGNYSDYIEWVIFQEWLRDYNNGVTVSPSTEVATNFVAAYANANDRDKQLQNPPPGGGIFGKFLRWLKTKNGKWRWADEKGVYTWHDWESGKDSHWNFGSWDGKTQMESFDGTSWTPR